MRSKQNVISDGYGIKLDKAIVICIIDIVDTIDITRRIMQLLKTINALKARRNLGQLLEEVFYNKDQFVIERAGKAMAVVISPSEYETFKRQREQDMGIFDQIRKKNKEASVKELEDDIQEAIEAVRKQNA